MSESLTADFLTPEAITAILTHMNEDHPEDTLTIVRGHGAADATAASMTGLDVLTAHFEAITPSGSQAVAIAWPEPLTDRKAVRVQVVALHQRAQELLAD